MLTVSSEFGEHMQSLLVMMAGNFSSFFSWTYPSFQLWFNFKKQHHAARPIFPFLRWLVEEIYSSLGTLFWLYLCWDKSCSVDSNMKFATVSPKPGIWHFRVCSYVAGSTCWLTTSWNHTYVTICRFSPEHLTTTGLLLWNFSVYTWCENQRDMHT